MICTKCKVEKSEEEFSFKNIEKGKRRTICKSCHSEYRKQKYIENKEKELEQVRKYRLNNPNKYSAEIKKDKRILNNNDENKKHSSYSKKAGRVYESKCKHCNKIVYLTSKELNDGFKRCCSMECRKLDFKDEYHHYYHDVKRRFKKYDTNNISLEYMKWLLEEKQNFKCNVTGLSIRLYKPNEKNILYNSASLDRIDSSKGYIEGNVQWVCLGANYMKMNFSNDELLETIRLIRAIV